MQNNRKIIVLAGGFSEEKEVSLITGAEITKALKQAGYIVLQVDPASFGSWIATISEIKKQGPFIVFNGLHGGAGENGQVQALLELEKIPFTGAGSRTSMLAMDKYSSQIIVRNLGIAIPETLLVRDGDRLQPKNWIERVGMPFVIKPNDSGSSVGISIVRSAQDIEPAVTAAFDARPEILIQQFIDGREITVTILGRTPLPVVEIKPVNGWYDYANKYTKGKTVYEAPAKLSPEEADAVQKLALAVYLELGFNSYARIDFRYTGKTWYFLEANSLPGMTPLSLTPMA
ncbi:MAG: D-alanine--D-alanine ligase, partial [Candidatus Cloacimonetes bacterium]|nr:D-alanine--D-alanine ligase [Candidatus Cloacimonadota bacterium]